MTDTATPVDNGVNVEFLLKAQEALADQPEGANFKWRVTNTWVNGHPQPQQRQRLLRTG